jgi:uncharacterized protein (TIGR02118 family)
MIKVSMLYPNEPDKNFNIPYYYNKHIPLLKKLLGTRCLTIAVEQGLGGATSDSKVTYILMGHFYFRSENDFHTSFSPNAPSIMNDVSNFTDSRPVIQISEVKI